MKVLFVCRGNVGRSQVATEFYNRMHPGGEGASAGIVVEHPGQKIGERPAAQGAIASMKEIGIDISKNTTTLLTAKMLDNYDKVIVMAEPENIPDYLRTSPKFEYWDIEDMKNQDLEKSCALRDQIKQLIQEHLSNYQV